VKPVLRSNNSVQVVEEFIAAVAADIDAAVLIADPDIASTYQRDQSEFTESERPAAVVAPRSEEEVSAVLQLAHRLGVVVIPRGAGSGLSGAANASAESITLSLHRMNRILKVDARNRVAVVEPGVITKALRDTAAAADLYYLPDPGSVDFCTLGGNIATNAGGMCCVKYGVTGDYVLGLRVALADGRILSTGRATVKGVAGYDLTRLFVGSEGTLGVVTEATLRLIPRPVPAHTLVATFPTLTAAGKAVSGIVESGFVPSLLEILDRTTVRAVDAKTRMGLGADVAAMLMVQSDEPNAAQVLTEIHSICAAANASDAMRTQDANEGIMLLEARRQALPALEQLGDWLLDDICVPRTAIVDLIAEIEQIADRLNLTIGVFGHAGDGNLHPTIIYDKADPASHSAALAAFDAITAHSLRLGGTITGEHGVGRLKRGWLATEQGPLGMEIHRAVKAALDPTNLLNPAALFTAAEDVTT
jgi:glycolate oxidase